MISKNLIRIFLTTTMLSSSLLAMEQGPDAENGGPERRYAPHQVRMEGFFRRHYESDIHRATLVRHQEDEGGEVAIQREMELPGHEGRQHIFVDLEDAGFGLPNILTGGYDYRGLLPAEEGFRGRRFGSLVYSDGQGGYFLPHITRERWERDERPVRAFVASYRADLPLQFSETAQFPQGTEVLAQGLYNIKAVREDGPHRLETWVRLDAPNEEVIIRSLTSHPSIAGMGLEVPFVLPALPEEVGEMQNSIARIRDSLDRQLEEMGIPDNTNSVFIIGPSGAGKSTIATLIAGGGLYAAEREDGMGLQLNAREDVGGIHIGHLLNVAGNQRPGIVYDRGQENPTVYFDCPGFGDPAGGAADIINVAGIQHLLKRYKSAKFLVTLSETQISNRGASQLPKLFNDLTSTIGDLESLKRNISLVITGQDRIRNLNTFLRRQFNSFRNVPGGAALNGDALGLLEFFVDNPERVIGMGYPRDVGNYESVAVLGSLRAMLEQSQFVYVPEDIRINIGNAGRLFAIDAGEDLNTYLKSYFRTEGNRSIALLGQKLLQRSGRSLLELRQDLSGLITNTREQGIDNPLEFYANLRQVFTPEVFEDPRLENTLGALSVLRTLEPNVFFSSRDLLGLLDEGLQKIEKLAHPAQVFFENNILTVYGSLIGLSEVLAAYQDNLESDIERIDVLASNKFIIDSDLKARGISVSIISPLWDVLGKYTINLAGLEGRPGKDGDPGQMGQPGKDASPGLPGGNGGYFFGKGHSFNGMEHLTINTSGGKGGKGGNGGKGSDGQPGEDATPPGTSSAAISEMKKVLFGRSSNFFTHTLPARKSEFTGHGRHHRHYHIWWTKGLYETTNQGQPGQIGLAGGRKGRGGFGGNSGEVQILGGLNAASIVAAQGLAGDDGNPGLGGQGGSHGRAYTAKNQIVWGTNALQGHRTLSTVLVASQGKAADGALGDGINDERRTNPVDSAAVQSDLYLQRFQFFYNQEAESGSIVQILGPLPHQRRRIPSPAAEE